MKLSAYILAVVATLLGNINIIAADIHLPRPEMTGGMPLNEALAKRCSRRAYDTSRELSMQQISDLLWAACGVNRADEQKRTNPTAINKQEIDLYVFTPQGVYLYNPFANMLILKAEGDHRKIVAGRQEFAADAPAILLMVADVAKFGTPIAERNMLIGAMDAGIVSENINLYCASAGLATVTRATMDSDAITTLLGLSEGQVPMLNNPVGYPKQ